MKLSTCKPKCFARTLWSGICQLGNIFTPVESISIILVRHQFSTLFYKSWPWVRKANRGQIKLSQLISRCFSIAKFRFFAMEKWDRRRKAYRGQIKLGQLYFWPRVALQKILHSKFIDFLRNWDFFQCEKNTDWVVKKIW